MKKVKMFHSEYRITKKRIKEVLSYNTTFFKPTLKYQNNFCKTILIFDDFYFHKKFLLMNQKVNFIYENFETLVINYVEKIYYEHFKKNFIKNWFKNERAILYDSLKKSSNLFQYFKYEFKLKMVDYLGEQSYLQPRALENAFEFYYKSVRYLKISFSNNFFTLYFGKCKNSKIEVSKIVEKVKLYEIPFVIEDNSNLRFS